jgi:hypothetical protein
MRDGAEQQTDKTGTTTCNSGNVYLALFELMHYRIRALGRLKLILMFHMANKK